MIGFLISYIFAATSALVCSPIPFVQHHLIIIFILAVNYNLVDILPSSASGIGRCEIKNGGCWKETRNGKTISACSVSRPLPQVVNLCLTIL